MKHRFETTWAPAQLKDGFYSVVIVDLFVKMPDRAGVDGIFARVYNRCPEKCRTDADRICKLLNDNHE